MLMFWTIGFERREHHAKEIGHGPFESIRRGSRGAKRVFFYKRFEKFEPISEYNWLHILCYGEFKNHQEVIYILCWHTMIYFIKTLGLRKYLYNDSIKNIDLPSHNLYSIYSSQFVVDLTNFSTIKMKVEDQSVQKRISRTKNNSSYE